MSETSIGIILDFIGDSLNDLAQQGVINKDKVDSFRTPHYFAEKAELRQIIKRNGKFTIKTFENINHPNGEFPLDPKVLAISFKALYGALISAHFGLEAMRNVFALFEVKVSQNISRFQNSKPGMQYFIVLRKN